MDKAHSATRPFWVIEIEEYLVLFLGIFSSVAAIEWVLDRVKSFLTGLVSDNKLSNKSIVPIEEALVAAVIFFLCKGLIMGLKIWKTRRYPGSYCYCFERKVNGEKRIVVGYFNLECLSDGSLSASGASFDWVDSQFRPFSIVRWSSEHVGTTEEQDKVKCYILYTVDTMDQDRREYTHGLLQFMASNDIGISGQAYRGHMQAVDPGKYHAADSPTYGERIGKRRADQHLEEYIAANAKLLLQKYHS
jgi:hypothetical protein